MAISKRTKKRLLILAGICVVLFSGLAAAYVVREGQLDRKAVASLETGMAAYEAEDYEAALHGIGAYLQRYGEEAGADTLYAYADSRLNVPVPNDRHITHGIALLERVLEVDSQHENAIDALLDLRLTVGQTLEALDLAERVLEGDPANAHAHAIRIFAYQLTGDIDAAINAASDQYEQQSGDVEIARRLIGLMLEDPVQRLRLQPANASQGGDSEQPATLLGRIEQEHGDEPDFVLMLAQAYRALDATDEAQRLLDLVIAMPVADDVTATNVAGEMMRSDAFGFQQAVDYIQEVIETRDSDGLRIWLAERIFQLGETESARVLAEQVMEGSGSYVHAQVLLALLAGEADDSSSIAEHVRAIKKTESSLGEVWGKVLDAILLSEDAQAAQVRPLLLDAIEIDPKSRYLRFALAIAYRDLGEIELAAQYLAPVVQAEPAWWHAGLEFASILEGLGYYSSAKQLLDEMMDLHPEVNAVRLRWAVISSLAVSSSDPIAARETLARITEFSDEVLAQYPDTEDALALARARCLGILSRIERQDDERDNLELTEQLRALIHELASASADPAVLRACREFNQRYELDLDDAMEGEGDDPVSIAAAAAELLAFQGRSEEGMSLLEDALAVSELAVQDQRYARVQFMDRFNLPGALLVWKQLLEGSPNSLALLRAASQSTAVLGDESLGQQVVDQLKAMTGEEGYAWRFAELRHDALMAESESDRVDVADRLGAMIRGGYAKPEARILLADVLVELDNPRGAMNQLTLAVDESPGHAAANLALARLAINQKRYPIARSALGRLSQAEQLSPGLASEIARLADSLGEREVAVLLRSRSGVAAYLGPAERLAQLRQFYLTGDEAKAQAIQLELLSSKDVAVLKQLAVILALRGGAEEAAPAIEAMQACPEATGLDVASTQAVIAELAGNPREALALIQEAANLREIFADRDLATQSLRLLLQEEDGLSVVVAALRDGGAAESANTSNVIGPATLYCFEQALSHQDVRRGLLQALGLEALRAIDPRAFRDAAGIIAEDNWGTRTGPSEGLYRNLDQLRINNPDEVSLYNLLTTLYLMSGQTAKAITLAQQTRSRFETDAISAQLLAQGYAQTGQWRLVLGAAQTWRQLASPTRENLEAIDLLTATALIETGDWEAAELGLGRYDGTSDQAIALLIRSYIRSGKLRAARSKFDELLDLESSRWRVTLVQLVLTDVVEIDAQVAGQWLDDLRPRIPIDELGERLLWAQAMFIVGQRLDSNSRLNSAYTAMRSMSLDSDFPPSGWLLIGVYHEMREELTEATEAYRQTLAIDPNQHQAANNLANILLAQGKLGEARTLSEQAVAITESQPRASYLDTLAQIERESGNTEAALNLLSQVVQIERENPKWYVRRAEILVEAGKLDEARDCIRRMQQWAGDIPSDDEETRSQLDAVLDRLG